MHDLTSQPTARVPVADGPGTSPRPAALVASGAALIAVSYGFARFAYGLFLPRFQAEFGLSATLAGFVGAGSYVGYGVAIVASALVTPRLGSRRVAIAAGVLATVGSAVVALAPSALVLAAGVLIAGSSTGVASPPLAAAIARWHRPGGVDRAQAVVNAGAGAGVAASGLLALAVVDRWRLAWALFAILAALTTRWVAATIPASAAPATSPTSWRRGPVSGRARLLVAASALGASSIAVWTFGQQALAGAGGSPLVGALAWTALGAAGLIGAGAGPVVDRVGIRRSWSVLMVVHAAATVAVASDLPPIAAVASAVTFGASYVALTGVVLIWATRLHGADVAIGVGAAFLAIAVGQLVAGPVIGAIADASSLTVAAATCAAIGLAGATIRPTTDRTDP